MTGERYIKQVLRTSGRNFFQSPTQGRITISGNKIYSNGEWTLSEDAINKVCSELEDYKLWWGENYETDPEYLIFTELMKDYYKRSNEYYETNLPDGTGYKKVFALKTPRSVYVEKRGHDRTLLRDLPEDVQESICRTILDSRMPF